MGSQHQCQLPELEQAYLNSFSNSCGLIHQIPAGQCFLDLELFLMPRPCAVEIHASFCATADFVDREQQRETPRRKAVASGREWPSFLAASVTLHGTRPWHHYFSQNLARHNPTSIAQSLMINLSGGSIAGIPLCCQQRTGPCTRREHGVPFFVRAPQM